MNRLVAIALPTCPAFVEALIRAFEDGDAVLPVDLRLAAPARQRILDQLRPELLIDESGESHRLGSGQAVEAGDALVIATSGTTGVPKGVVLTHEAVLASARATSERLAVDPSTDRWWACLPLAHIGGLSVVTRSLLLDVEFEVSPYSPAAASEALARGATLTSLVPTALGRLGEEQSAAWRTIVLGGQAPPAQLPQNVVTTYGMTETGSGVVYDGVPLRGVDVRIERDEILLRGPMLLRGYRDGSDPKTAAGWLPTGDAGGWLPDGRLAVFGRIGDLIITGGENVWPASVEPVLSRHPAVAAVAVAGRPDAEWGERVTAFVVVSPVAERADGAAGALDPTALLAELRELVHDEIAGYAAPRELVLVDALPTTAIGKVRREALKSLEGPSTSI